MDYKSPLEEIAPPMWVGIATTSVPASDTGHRLWITKSSPPSLRKPKPHHQPIRIWALTLGIVQIIQDLRGTTNLFIYSKALLHSDKRTPHPLSLSFRGAGCCDQLGWHECIQQLRLESETESLRPIQAKRSS